MTATTTKAKGVFIWYEHLSRDSKAALAFYKSILGWTSNDQQGQRGTYTIVNAGGAPVGGMMTLPEGVEKAAWNAYVGVDNVDAFTDKVKAAGGKVLRAPDDIPGIGRFAMVTDPQGAVFTLMTPSGMEPMPTAAKGTPGHVGWRELHAGNGDAAFKFYSEMFGWTQDSQVDMGHSGVYRVFATGNGPVGGMMTKMATTPNPHWLFYFNVDGLDAAVKRVRDAKGTVITDAHEVPGGDWIAHCIDPQGAVFGLMSKKR
jgi:hypothetical protein